MRHWLHAVNRSDVMRFAVVIPGDDLGERDLGAVFDKKFPALCEEPVVAAVNEVLVVCLRAVMLERGYMF